MKRYESEEYKAMAMDGSTYLYDTGDTLEEIKSRIDFSNRLAKLKGYKQQQYYITFVEYYRYVSDDGHFIKRETFEEALEIYPAKL